MKSKLNVCVTVLSLMVAFAVSPPASGAGGATPLGNFGPTGIDISVLPDHTLKVLKVQAGSPAEGKIRKGEIVTEINGRPPLQKHEEGGPVFDTFKQLASFITEAEAGDGLLRFTLRPDGEGAARTVNVTIPVLGAYGKNWPLNCGKSDRIIRANADYIASVAGEDGAGLTQHNLYNGFAILMLLSTGQEEDLALVRKVYQTRMADFDEKQEVGSHNWHNGLQGMAVCEYYLRTGDDAVMPLINAICEAARKYQVHGGWSHWAKGINPQYTAGGLMNAAGIQVLTTLLLAKQCGAEVDDRALRESLRFFYRFVGHGNTPYGDHRPESGLTDNGKTAMLALAMNAASKAENGQLYARVRDRCALTPLYNYEALLRGHTGGNGAKWHGIAAALLADKKPRLYRNQLEQKQWFFELSRRWNGAMGACGSGRYDKESYGYATGLALTAPRKTLQITGAPTSPHAQSFRLPPRPWGRRADLAFLSLDGGPAYKPSKEAPHRELAMVSEADATALRRLAAHPVQAFREAVAKAIREKERYRLIEELLASEDPLSRQTACLALNDFQPWQLRFSIGTRSRGSIDPAHFTPRMFESLMAIITDPTQALWSVDKALAALAVASSEQIESRLDDILPWLEHAEWWLNESATIALTPAMDNEETLTTILPMIVDCMAINVHIKGRGGMGWMLKNATADAPETIRNKVVQAHAEVFERFIHVPNPEPGVDLAGITSTALEQQLGGMLRDENWRIRDDPAMILKGARLAADRIDEFRARELQRVIALLVDASERLEGENLRQMGRVIVKHFRPRVVGEDPEDFERRMRARQNLKQMNMLLSIDRMAGLPGGWELLGSDETGRQEWWHTSFEPENKPPEKAYDRYRAVELPPRLDGWFKPDYAPEKKGWTQEARVTVGPVTPKAYGVSREWFKEYLPESGEVIFLRKTFDLDDRDFALMCLTVYSRQGYDVYLNGHKIVSQRGRSKTWQARRTYLTEPMLQHLKEGENVLALRGFLQYFRGRGGGIDAFVEKLDELPAVN